MTLSFYQPAKGQTTRSKIGNQAHQLTMLLDAGFPVPKGFLVSADTCKAFFNNGRLGEKIKMLLERANYHDPGDLSRVSHAIGKLIMSGEFPHEVAQSLLEAGIKLGNERVMLTASPLGSDNSKNESPPDRIYGIVGEANILLSIRKLWASQFTSDNLYYIYSSEEHEFPSMAICVQLEPQSVVSGILTTTDSKDKRLAHIRAVWGEGAITSKLQGDDSYFVDKETGNLKESLRGLQTREYAWKNGELNSSTVPASRQKKQKLSPGIIKSLSKLAKEVQQKLFYPQEVTFAFDGQKLFLIDTHSSKQGETISPHQVSQNARRVLLKGVGATPGIITGMVRVVRGNEETDVHPGEIVVAKTLQQIADNVVRAASGIIVEEEMRGGAILDLAQKGVALLMSAAGATDLLEPGSFITLHTPRGEVLSGGYTAKIFAEPTRDIRSATKVGTSVSLGFPIQVPELLRGHLILTPDRLIRSVGAHPLKLAREHHARLLTDPLVHALSSACTKYSQDLLYAFSSLSTSDYASLVGGQSYEISEERNPLMGFMGLTRILTTPDLIAPEIAALSRVRREKSGKHLSLLFPPGRSAREVKQFEEFLSANDLGRSAGSRHFVDLSFPSLAWELESLATLTDGVVLNLNHIYTHLFAHDPENDAIRLQESEAQEPLLGIMEQTRKFCEQEGLRFIVCGSLLEHDTFLSYVVRAAVSEIIVPAKIISMVSSRLMTLEQELINHV